MNTAIIVILSSLVAFFSVKWCYFKVLKIAIANSLVDNPDARKLQKRPIPVLGGIAVFFGLIAGVLTGACMTYILTLTLQRFLGPVLCAIVIMIFTGALDDIQGLTPRARFFVEIATIIALIYASGACIDSFHGLWGIGDFSWWIAVPLTVFACVGIINAVNLIDGVNGLCSGLCILYSLLFGAMFLKVDDIPDAVLAFSLAASATPFLFHNVFGKRSRMFLGDAGTLMLGMIMCWFTINILRSDSLLKINAAHKNYDMIAMVLAILSVPVFDTIRVMTQRMYHHQSPFHPDKTHLHHVFIRAGISHSVTTLLILSINSLIVLIWFVCAKLRAGLDLQLYIVIFYSVLLIWGIYFLISWHERHHTSFMHRLAIFGIKSHVGHTRQWLALERWLDEPLGIEYRYEDEEEVEVQDRTKILDFMKGKAEVYVSDIKARSGVDPDEVDDLISRGVSKGLLIVVKSGPDGLPTIITLPEE
ncbi:MAG: undecaprenyl/decaprenyl-phosphate alpha-N-acetylglucosaminyl 1-phosphate transferase [Bacteroidales bacterium]|nr:undecaprenyl/decaprenyl-phosphate alpha-N-acetylglucosaminyl 1-phosphate transferase [Bacteroidales bacterium]